ncbi:MAG TPA: hypothetical protein VFE57_00670 [Cyclobacteriaceae bacterium]|jgi:hypothetical protein|nr:hypothetical protein [Cyclobacteriaceae bacterium]
MMPLLVFLIFLTQLEVPFKANEEFTVTHDYQYKSYKDVEHKDLDYSSTRRTAGNLLYLTTRVKLNKLSSEEVRVHVGSNLQNLMVNKKAEQDMVLKIDFGFIVDVKDRLTAHEYTILLISPEKKEVSRIHILLDKDGTFLVNGQKRGKF